MWAWLGHEEDDDLPKLMNIIINGGPLSALTCCVNVRLLLRDKKIIAVNLFTKLGAGSYTMQAMMKE